MKKTTSEKILLEKIDSLTKYISEIEWSYDFIYVIFKRCLKCAKFINYNPSREFFSILWEGFSADIFLHLHGSRLYFACLEEFEERNKK